MDTREQIIRDRCRREKRQRWRHIRELILSGSEQFYLEFWREHWPPDKNDMKYAVGQDSTFLRRHLRVELHYLRQSVERQEAWEPVIWG